MAHIKRWKVTTQIEDGVRTLLSEGHDDIDEAKASAEKDLRRGFERARILWTEIQNLETFDLVLGEVLATDEASRISFELQRDIEPAPIRVI
jgi:hypothetical protein